MKVRITYYGISFKNAMFMIYLLNYSLGSMCECKLKFMKTQPMKMIDN